MVSTLITTKIKHAQLEGKLQYNLNFSLTSRVKQAHQQRRIKPTSILFRLSGALVFLMPQKGSIFLFTNSGTIRHLKRDEFGLTTSAE